MDARPGGGVLVHGGGAQLQLIAASLAPKRPAAAVRIERQPGGRHQHAQLWSVPGKDRGAQGSIRSRRGQARHNAQGRHTAEQARMAASIEATHL